MIKKLLSAVIICIAAGLVSGLYAQNISGIVNYRGEMNKKYVDSFVVALNSNKEIPMSTKQAVTRMYRDATPDTYILSFKGAESYYYYVKPLEDETVPYNVGSKAGLTSYYTNNKTKEMIMTNSGLGDVLMNKNIKWDITQTSKKIGKYTCYKAIFANQTYGKKKTVAWFTPEISVNFGPKYYKGLPGLILQIETQMFSLTATKVTLNPNESDLKIERVKNRKQLISMEEYSKRATEIRENHRKQR
ncbi:GLPGLI family protein [Zhouia sp. PK063]|uniref:GLPGLI family protein n=1 Tax=Zhouia sp. PK063 TaxID=3373602 RepID=UPI00378816FA